MLKYYKGFFKLISLFNKVMLSIEETKNLLKKHGARPSKKLGQNFLVNGDVLEEIVETSSLFKNDVVLEVGPGTGVLTFALAQKVKAVIAFEKDEKLYLVLKKRIKDLALKNVKIFNEDILKVDPKSFLPKDYKIIANIPYYLTSPLIRKFLETENQPTLIILMVQKEVAERICAGLLTERLEQQRKTKRSLLAISVQFYAKARIISFVSPASFWPEPKVTSAILKITPNRSLKYSIIFVKEFFKIAKAGFSQPRKQLINNFSRELKISRDAVREWLLKNGIKPEQRAEKLTLKDWQKLTKTFNI